MKCRFGHLILSVAVAATPLASYSASVSKRNVATKSTAAPAKAAPAKPEGALAPHSPAGDPPSPVRDEPVFAELSNDSESLLGKYIHDLYSPFVNPLTLSIFAGGTVSTLTLLATGKNFEDHVLDNAAEHQPLGRFSTLGDYSGQMVPNIAYFGYFAGEYLITKDPLSRFRAEMMFRSTLAATSLSTVLKMTVREPRPSNNSELTSFPSGHSTSIFAFATTIAALHGVYWGAAAYGLATFVAFSRMNDNRHRLHDVVAGATIGSMYGLSVYQRMRDATAPTLKTAKRFQYELIPAPTDGGAMLGLAASF